MGGLGRSRYRSERRDSYRAHSGSSGSSRYPSVRDSWQNNHTRHIIGNNNSAGGNLRGAPPPPRNIFVSRVLDGDTKLMTDFLNLNNVKVNEIQMTSHPESKYSSFKINISVYDRDKVLDPSFWPFGIKCEMWREPRSRQNSDGNNHPYNIFTDSNDDDESNSTVSGPP